MKSEFNVIVAGSRIFNDFDLLTKKLDEIFIERKPTSIICGEAQGADTLGRIYAKERGINVLSFPANWDKYGKVAGFVRNTEMLKHADAVIAFWDGKSKGTEHMIRIAKQAGIKVHTVIF